MKQDLFAVDKLILLKTRTVEFVSLSIQSTDTHGHKTHIKIFVIQQIC